jgi:hypothetical protein
VAHEEMKEIEKRPIKMNGQQSKYINECGEEKAKKQIKQC